MTLNNTSIQFTISNKLIVNNGNVVFAAGVHTSAPTDLMSLGQRMLPMSCSSPRPSQRWYRLERKTQIGLTRQISPVTTKQTCIRETGDEGQKTFGQLANG